MKTLFSLACMLLALQSTAQLSAEAGGYFLPPVQRGNFGLSASAIYRLGDFEPAAVGSWEISHNATAGAAVGYRFPGTHLVSDPEDGLVLQLGYAYTWHTAEVLKSGEGIRNQWFPVVGLKLYVESTVGRSVYADLRYQGNGLLFGVGIRF